MATAIAIAASAVDDSAYQTLGRLAVQQNGRRKPLDTLAREVVKQIHGAPSVKERGALGNTIATWSAVAVLLDWSVRPQYWDDQATSSLSRPNRPLRSADPPSDTARRMRGEKQASRTDPTKWLSAFAQRYRGCCRDRVDGQDGVVPRLVRGDRGKRPGDSHRAERRTDQELQLHLIAPLSLSRNQGNGGRRAARPLQGVP